jgi:hypothetical protein
MFDKDLVLRAGVSYLLGVFVAEGLEEAIDIAGGEQTELPDTAFGVLGAALGADKRMLDLAAKQIRRKFGKSWSRLSKTEWEEFKRGNPETAEYLKEALRI